MFNLKLNNTNFLSLRDCLGLNRVDRLYYADNVAITAGSGTTIATDDVSSVHFQKVKINLGGDGTDGSLWAGAVTITSGNVTVNTGSATGSAVPANAFYAAGKDLQGNLRGVTVDLQGRYPAIPTTDVISHSGNIYLAPQRQPINTNTTGAILVSGQANRKIRVLNGVIMAATATTVQLKSNNNSDVTGPLAIGAKGGFQIPEAEIGNFETLTGQNLTVVLSAANVIGGWLTFVYV